MTETTREESLDESKKYICMDCNQEGYFTRGVSVCDKCVDKILADPIKRDCFLSYFPNV